MGEEHVDIPKDHSVPGSSEDDSYIVPTRRSVSYRARYAAFQFPFYNVAINHQFYQLGTGGQRPNSPTK